MLCSSKPNEAKAQNAYLVLNTVFFGKFFPQLQIRFILIYVVYCLLGKRVKPQWSARVLFQNKPFHHLSLMHIFPSTKL